jgi:ABC-type molybdenum transport system ATPase subunit/photorepair protein PhrA
MYPRISLETVLRDDPDVILDLSGQQESEAERQAASAQVLALWNQQSQLSAVRKNRVVIGTSNALLVPGPRAPEAARLLFDYIHPKNSKGTCQLSPLLEVANLQLSYGSRIVLRSATLSAQSEEFIALVGVNGAGKSTLLDLIAGFRKPAAGSISIAGRDQKLWSLRELSQRVSHLPQAVHADLPYTAEQLVAMGRYPHTDRWFESDEDHSFIREAMERAHCWEYRHRNFRSLSGGERQRVLTGGVSRSECFDPPAR